MAEVPGGNIMWVRHDGDEGLWWPGVHVKDEDESSFLVAIIGHRDGMRGDLSTTSPFTKRSRSSTGKISLFWLPHPQTLIVATRWHSYEQSMPLTKGIMAQSRSHAGAGKPYLEDAKRQMDSSIASRGGAVYPHLSDARTPATPSTACNTTCSTVTPATPWDCTSLGRCASSGGHTSLEDSPARSTSSSGTELDVAATQLDPSPSATQGSPIGPVASPGHHADFQASGAPRSTGSDCEPPTTTEQEGVEDEGAACSDGNMHSGGAKRRRMQAPTLQSSQESEGAAFPAKITEAEVLRASPADLSDSPRRKKECTASSQFPRLENSPPSGARPFPCREQHANHCAATVCMELDGPAGRGSGAGGIFEGMAGLAPTQCEDQVHEEGDADCLLRQGGVLQKDPVGGITTGVQECIAAPFVGQDSMDVCDSGSSSEGGISSYLRGTLDLETAGHAYQSEISEEGLSQESSSDDHQSVTSRQIDPDSPLCQGWLVPGRQECATEKNATPAHCGDDVAALGPSNDPELSDGVPSGGVAGVEAEVEEAAALRGTGVTMDDGFSDMFRMLKKLGWKWGPAVDRISSDYWILKPGATFKTTEEGVGKFKTEAAVVRYVQRLLTAHQGDASDRQGESESEQDQSEDGHFDGDAVASQADSCSTVEMEDEGGEMATPDAQALQTALEALHPSRAPEVLAQRAAEFSQVLHFIKRSVTEASGGSLYLCGCPGTGKTQTMSHVQAEIARISTKMKAPAPVFHAFSGTAFTDAHAMHGALWQAVANKNADVPADIEKALGKKLAYARKPTPNLPMVVVVLDEIDQLISSNRQVLRKLFEWADAPKSRLILVGIANSFDFDVGFSGLKKKPAKLTFAAYTPEDLKNILTERVGEVVQPAAIQLCSKKVASTHGDARRAISYCREAVVLAERELQAKLDSAPSLAERQQVGQGGGVCVVTIRHMSKALAAGRASQYGDSIAALSMQAQIVLCVAAAAVATPDSDGGRVDGTRHGSRGGLTQGDLHDKCKSVWGKLRTAGGLSQIEFSGTIDMLEGQGLLAFKKKNRALGRARQLVLQIELSDVEVALGEQAFFKTVTNA